MKLILNFHTTLLLTFALLINPVAAFETSPAADTPNVTINPKLFENLEYRSLGFMRGGRSTAVAGVANDPLTYYFGSTGGGLFKSTDAGLNWEPVTDDYLEAGSIGAVAVANSDPNVVYVGTGSACPRGNISPGVGMYRSTDAGSTWQHIGLPEAGQIGDIQVHPQDANLVYVAALGHIFGPNEERGVFRSRDGGENWEKVLYLSDKTGAVDLAMDATNPRILYAAMWTAERKPWTFISGSEESGLYRSTDGGNTWEKVAGGIPQGLVGKIAVDVSPANPERVWALIEAPDDKGGIYRSDDGGRSWHRINNERRFLQRAWYYIHLVADPQDPETVYVMNTGFYRSTDGGEKFDTFRTPHGDNHALWINPANPKIMINGNDGGANVSMNGGRSWTGQMNQPTAEFYRVSVDQSYPYRVYGAQQDNSTISVSSGGASPYDSYPVGGGESGHIAVDPRDNETIYAGSYGGTITRVNTRKDLYRNIRAYPEAVVGQQAKDMKYRFQWNAPIRISPHDPDTIYHAAQFVLRSRDQGETWEAISPDLTRNDVSKQEYAGEPITRDNTGVEVYGTVFAFEESPHQRGLLWAGTDDGRLHISRNDGEDWEEITPPEMPEWGVVNMIDLSAHSAGRAHIAVFRYRQDDFTPYIFQTNDYGKTWKRLADGANGIPSQHFVRVVREDRGRQGLLYAGTEFGMYISFDDGARWQPFQLNLPVTPVTDLALQRDDLVLSTQGRAFWILDDLSPLRQMTSELAELNFHLFEPVNGLRMPGSSTFINYYLSDKPEESIKIEVLNQDGDVVYETTVEAEDEEAPSPTANRRGRSSRFSRGGDATARAGFNRFDWDHEAKAPFEVPEGTTVWGRGGGGPEVVPGTYQVRLTSGDWSDTATFEVNPDPRVQTSLQEYEAQFELAMEVGREIDRLYEALSSLREVKEQVSDIAARTKKAGYGEEIPTSGERLTKTLTEVEKELTQLKGEANQDALNFPGRLDNQFLALYSDITSGNYAPKPGARQRLEDLRPELNSLLQRLESVLETDLADFNRLVEEKDVPPVIVARDDSD